jgi:hypothetical protein
MCVSPNKPCSRGCPEFQPNRSRFSVVSHPFTFFFHLFTLCQLSQMVTMLGLCKEGK